MKNKIDFPRESQFVYQVVFNGIELGSLKMSDTGDFYYYPLNEPCFNLPGWVLIEIGQKIKQLNLPDHE